MIKSSARKAARSTDSTDRAVVDGVLSRMTLEEKVGQCLTLSWRGAIITPSVVDNIRRLHCGGLRIEPYTTEAAQRLYYGRQLEDKNFIKPADYFTVSNTYFRIKYPGYNLSAGEYAAKLNRLKDIAIERPSGVPLHICTDFEGDFSHDFPFDGINLFPANMGIRAAGTPALAYKAAHAVARQLSAIGINMLHSPVCDINVNPRNPSVNIRAFSDDADVCIRYLIQYHKGLEDGGVIATAKHFPGNGDSEVDAHDSLPVSHLSRERLDAVELAPYRALIAKGLRAIMTAHDAFPALDQERNPTTLSAKTLIGLLRGELGFEGVITSDAMGMGAIVAKWGVPLASAMAIKAGCNLVLVKADDESRSQTFFEVRRWVQDGRITEQELDDSVRRVLLMKKRQGLFVNGGKVNAPNASKVLRDKVFVAGSRNVARKAITIIRDRQGLLPLSVAKRVMVIEQMVIPEFVPNNSFHHAHCFNEAMLGQSLNVVNVDTEFQATKEEQELVLSLLDQVDLVVMTNYYWRVVPQNNSPLVKAIAGRGKPLVVVTNNPYPMGAPEEAGTVVCSYGATPQSLLAAADLLFGKARSAGAWPLEHTPMPK
jgi:beta-N-acetylhexosaminidase